MENNDFYKSFMSGVKNGVPSISSEREAKIEKNKIIIWVVAGLALLLLVVIGIVALIANNSSTITDSEEDTMDAEVSDEEVEESPSGETTYYSGSGKVISLRMGCKNDAKEYQFYKDNTYEIYFAGKDTPTEIGTYKVDNGAIILTIAYGADRMVRLTESNLLMDGAINLECEQYEDY